MSMIKELISDGASKLMAYAVIGVARLVSGVRATWDARNPPRALPTLYFANHASHGDFVLIWATLPPELRNITRPVAAADYWGGTGLRGFVGQKVFHALLIDRVPTKSAPSADAAGTEPAKPSDPIEQMTSALNAGDSLIMFPEGTRNTTDEIMLPFKSGLYHIARQCPQVLLVPVWIDNLKRVLPKGALVPVPLACTVNYGAPLALQEGEDKASFLQRARQAVLALRPEYDQPLPTADQTTNTNNPTAL